jgi:transcriptional regulator with XRE-family HTH domain
MFDPNEGVASIARAKLLGSRLRELRLQRNITQAELAKASGVSRPTLAALERDGRGTVETLAATLYALGRESELDSLLLPDPPSTLLEVVRPSIRRRARS